MQPIVIRQKANRKGQNCVEKLLMRVSLACARAVRFLLQQQSENGAWQDFRLAPGRADAWVTAYVGRKLLSVPKNSSDLAFALQRAIEFLENARHKRGGWAYNIHCEPDADSTAQTILFFRGAGHPVLLRDYAALARFQRPEGAFATYKMSDPAHGWGRGHPDVTVVALQALAGILPQGHVILTRGYATLRDALRRADPWASYWWLSPLYLARELLMLQKDQPGAPICLPPRQIGDRTSCFDEALALDVGLLVNQRFAQILSRVHRLLLLQQSDGGWPSVPILRITNPRSESLDDRVCRLSPIARDDRRLFTSATVLAALNWFEMLTTTPSSSIRRMRVGNSSCKALQQDEPVLFPRGALMLTCRQAIETENPAQALENLG